MLEILTQEDRGLNSQAAHGSMLKSLFADLPGILKIKGDTTVAVTSLVMDSRKVIPGSLFFAMRGDAFDGNQFVSEAIDRGAVAIVSDQSIKTISQVPAIAVTDIRQTLAEVSKRFYGAPDEKLKLFGVTGTNGKTTVTSILKHLYQFTGTPTGMIGTISYDLGGRTLPSMKTTPESIDTYGMLHQMLQASCETAVMEVSSHGVALKRIHGMHFDVAIFLNLTQDHLDFHGDMESYYQDKKAFFTGQTASLPKIAIVNIDDPYGQRLVSEIPQGVQVVTFGYSPNAIVRADNIALNAEGSTFDLILPENEMTVTTSMLGKYNVINTLAALSAVWATGQFVKPFVDALKHFTGVPGRMEKVNAGQPFTVLVDYAHTDDALRNGLIMLREISKGKLIVVFGCGGNRDRRKRSKMMHAVNDLADSIWATSDNPRTEPIQQIFDDMREGMTGPDKVQFVEERRLAIQQAIEAAKDGDVVLIAGKGHETYQEIGNTVVPFDDRLVAKELLSIKGYSQ